MNLNVVYIVTNPENGWDCIEGVFTSLEKAYEHLEVPYDGQEITYSDLVGNSGSMIFKRTIDAQL